MKKYILSALAVLVVFAVNAQETFNIVSVSIAGNKDLQFSIDGSNFNLANATVDGNKTSFVINGLQLGQHSYQVRRTTQNTNRTERINSTFTLRSGFDMRIKLNLNGSLELIESKAGSIGIVHTPMTSSDFNALLQTVRYQRSVMGKRNVITNAFNNTAYYFTSSQVAQLIQQVNAENYRLELAKLSYRSVTDRDNFYQVNNLLFSQASRDELQSYIDNYYERDDIHQAMSDVDFNALYQTIRQQWPASAQVNAMTNAFNNPSYYFSSYQARQLILLINGESNRLQLAKLSYRSITDPLNFNLLYDLFSRQSSKDELAAYVNNFNNTDNTHIAMSDLDFNALYRNIQQQYQVSTQISLITNAFNNTSYYFTSYQARQLIQLIFGDADRLPLAKLSYRCIIDRENFSQVSNLLSSQYSRDELAAYISSFNSGNTGNNYGNAMPDAEFNVLYQSIQGKFFPNEKMSSLTDLFTNTTDHFTTAQAKQLIALVTFESNRLQLAKLSYRTIVDRNNFSQLYDLLSSQANRNELDTYVKSYRD